MESVLGFGVYAVSFIVLITILVFVHEMGHYLVARWAGVRVEVFSIGFGPELMGWNDSKGTRWKISSIPLGGYVKFFGDAGAASQGDTEVLDGLTPDEREVSFHHKKLHQRAAIVAAGPFANFAYAIVILAIVFVAFGQRFTPPEIGRVLAGSTGMEAGFAAGDVVLAVDGETVRRFEELDQAIFLNPGRELQFLVRRNGEELVIAATPEEIDGTERQSIARKFGDLGLRPSNPAVVGRTQPGSPAEAAGFLSGDQILSVDGEEVYNFEQLQRVVGASEGRPLNMLVRRGQDDIVLTLSARSRTVTTADGEERQRWLIGIFGAARDPSRLSPGEALAEAVWVSYDMLVRTLEYVGEMIVGDRGTEDLGGPLRIAQASGQAAQIGFEQFVFLSVVISLNLGLVNLFPIPLLDGGHLLMYGFEAIRGRPLTERMQEYAFRFGLALVLTFTVFATWNDLVNLRVVEFLTGLFS